MARPKRPNDTFPMFCLLFSLADSVPLDDLAPVLSFWGVGSASGGEKSRLGNEPGCDVDSAEASGVSDFGSFGASGLAPDDGEGGFWDNHRAE